MPKESKLYGLIDSIVSQIDPEGFEEARLERRVQPIFDDLLNAVKQILVMRDDVEVTVEVREGNTQKLVLGYWNGGDSKPIVMINARVERSDVLIWPTACPNSRVRPIIANCPPHAVPLDAINDENVERALEVIFDNLAFEA